MGVGEGDGDGCGDGDGDGDAAVVGASVGLMCVEAAVATPVGVRVGTIGSGVGLGGISVGSCVGCSSAGERPTPSRAASRTKIPMLLSRRPPQRSSFPLLTPPPHEQQDHAD
jgi:hypothetical protein